MWLIELTCCSIFKVHYVVPDDLLIITFLRLFVNTFLKVFLFSFLKCFSCLSSVSSTSNTIPNYITYVNTFFKIFLFLLLAKVNSTMIWNLLLANTLYFSYFYHTRRRLPVCKQPPFYILQIQLAKILYLICSYFLSFLFSHFVYLFLSNLQLVS